MKLQHGLLAIGMLCLSITCYTQTAYKKKKTDSLYVGKKVPALQLTEWVKGKPVTQLEKGKTYLINFTIINCPHCGPAITALSQIAKKYGDKLTIFSVYFDSAKYVREYVNRLGDRFPYSAAVDNSEPKDYSVPAIMYQNWMVNGGVTGYPTACIVNRNGELAWIGHPVSWYLDSLVSQVIATGSINKDKLEAWGKNGAKVMTCAMEALKERDKYEMAIHLLDSFLVHHPNNGDRIWLKLKLLIKYDEPKAWQYARSVLNGYCKEKHCEAYYILATMASIFIENAATLKRPDWGFVAALAEEQTKMSDKMYWFSFLDIQAAAMNLKRDYKAAVDLQTKAIDHLQYKPGGYSRTLDQYYNNSLKLYKEKAGL